MSINEDYEAIMPSMPRDDGSNAFGYVTRPAADFTGAVFIRILDPDQRPVNNSDLPKAIKYHHLGFGI